MTDVNEQSFSAGINIDTAAAQAARPQRSRIPAPIWRFRPTLQPIGVVRTIRTRIIPKIVLALRSTPKAAEPAKQQGPDAISQFASLVMGDKDAAAFAFVQEMMAQGSSVESVFFEFAGADRATSRRTLGIRCDRFCQCDAWRRPLAAHHAAAWRGIFREREARSDGGESALLTTIPGEQHSFGLSMVAEFFRRAGWNLCTGPFSSHQELTSLVHNHWFDVVGFSVSSDRRLEELKQDIHDIRRDSRNKNVGIMLGGPMMARDPGLVAIDGRRYDVARRHDRTATGTRADREQEKIAGRPR